MNKTDRLDRILLRRGWVTESQVAHALKQQKAIREPFGSTLVVFGFLTETQLAEALAEQYGTPKWDPETAVVERRALDLFPESWVREKGILPLAFDPAIGKLEVALTDPENETLLDDIRSRAGVETVVIAVVPRISLQRLWDQFYANVSTNHVPDSDRVESAQAPSVDTTGGLGLEFSFSVEESIPQQQTSEPVARVLLWLSQPFVARLLKSLLESERCRVLEWDGRKAPVGTWDYLVYDSDSLAAVPEALRTLKRHWPHIQCVLRPSLTTALLQSPLSYGRMREGYVHLAEYALDRGDRQPLDRRFSRYALAVARNLHLTPFEIDTLLVACEMTPFFANKTDWSSEWETIASDLRSPFPVIDIYRAAGMPFSECEADPGQSAPDSPLTARVYDLVSAFLTHTKERPVTSIDSLSEFTDLFRQEAGTRFDPVVVEALLRVVREEVLEGCLPPGPSEVMLVSDHPVIWSSLRLQVENEGWRIVTANGPAEARDLAERRKPDAVVWAAGGAIDWIEWQTRKTPGIANFLLLDDPNLTLGRKALESGYEDVWNGEWDAGIAVAKMQRAVERKPNATPTPGTVSGSLEQLSVIDLIQVLTAGARNVAIDLTHESESAKIVFWHGQVKHAVAAGREGEEAVHWVLKWDSGTFTLRQIDAMPPVNCHTSNEAMLLEGCRLMDEGAKLPISQL